MPGWHEKTKALQVAGKIQLVGIIQEQHAQRCRLFMQWHKMDWPILVDALNMTGSKVVPRFTGIDEHGVVRVKRFGRGVDIVKDFIDVKYKKPREPARTAALGRGALAKLIAAGDETFLWGGVEKLDATISIYEKALKKAPRHGPTLFRLGVAHRRRYESRFGKSADFQKAVEFWAAALDVDPNQYIWARRIQQFGPMLAKPYPFYNWVAKAQASIKARGEKPIHLLVPLTDSELLGQGRWQPGEDDKKNPDPQGRITRDKGRLVRLDVAAVPAVGRSRGDFRLHVALSPGKDKPAHWNNEAEPLRLWIDAPEGVVCSQLLLTHPNPKQAVTNEERRIEVDVRILKGVRESNPIKLKGYVLYNVCEDEGGQCLLRRQDFEITVKPSR